MSSEMLEALELLQPDSGENEKWRAWYKLEEVLTPKEPEDMREEVASQIYDAMRWAVNQTPGCRGILLPNWQAGGNSFVQQKAREVAAVALQYQPSERSGEVSAEAFPHCYIGRMTFAEWKEEAKKDHVLHGMVPSELREILAFAEKMQNCAEYWRNEMSEDKRESNILRQKLAATAPSRVQLPPEDEAVIGAMALAIAKARDTSMVNMDLARAAYRALLNTMKGE